MTTELAAWSVTRRRPIRWSSARFDSPSGPRLRSGLAQEHARAPFRPRDVRDAARRVVEVAQSLGFEAQVVRGGLDLGGAELDHVWAVVEDRVVDAALPVNSEAFASALRAFVAGDVEEDDLDRAAHGYAFGWRVLGEFPSTCNYLGLPVFGSR